MERLSFSELLTLHEAIIAQSGGSRGVRDEQLLRSALDQPFQTFSHQDLYPTITHKAAVLGFSLINNHGFVDGNKRIGHAAMETFLLMNGYEIHAGEDEQEAIVLAVAASEMKLDRFTDWLMEVVSVITDDQMQ